MRGDEDNFGRRSVAMIRAGCGVSEISAGRSNPTENGAVQDPFRGRFAWLRGGFEPPADGVMNRLDVGKKVRRASPISPGMVPSHAVWSQTRSGGPRPSPRNCGVSPVGCWGDLLKGRWPDRPSAACTGPSAQFTPRFVSAPHSEGAPLGVPLLVRYLLPRQVG